MKRGHLQAGETLVVTGATGGIGFAAMQLGRHLGARVIGAVGSAEKAQFLRAHGFDETIDYSVEGFKDRVNALTGGRGADVIFEVVGGDIFEQSLRAINVGGRILVLGFAGGKIGNAPANLPLLKNASIVGSFLGGWRQRDPEGVAAMTREMLEVLAKGDLKTPVSGTFALAEAARAMAAATDRRNVGQVVVLT